MDIRGKISQQVIFQRKKAKLSQEKLAELANVHRTYISQIERNLKSPTLEVVFNICHALSIKPSDFIRGIENELLNK
jgi:transcriptional regulator with XRE-family HTH domain